MLTSLFLYTLILIFFVATRDNNAVYSAYAAPHSKNIQLFQHGEIWHTGCNYATNLFSTKHHVRRPWLHPCLLLLSAAPFLHKKRLHGIAPCGNRFAQSAASSPRIIYPPAQDQPGQASPGWIEYASLERGQFRPRSLMDQAVANG